MSEEMSDIASEVARLDHRARCKKRSKRDSLESDMKCIHNDALEWELRLRRARGVLIRDRPRRLRNKTTRVQTGLGRLYITVSFLDDKPFEVFCHVGVESGVEHPDAEEIAIQRANAEEVGRLVSLCLRTDIPVHEIVGQLRGIKGPTPVRWERKLVHGIGDAVAIVLSEYKEEA